MCGKSAFDKVFAQASVRVYSDWLCLLAVPNATGSLRLGVILPRKRVKSAVLRNAVRRHIRETLRCAVADGTGYDVVLLARKSAPLCSDWSVAQNKKQLRDSVGALASRVLRTMQGPSSLSAQPHRSARRPRHMTGSVQ